MTFSYTATSTSATDAPLQWSVTLHTCQDANANGWCDTGEPYLVSHGERIISILGRRTATVQWSVNLDQPEGTYRYHFHAVCSASPCAGVHLPSGSDNRTGGFQLAYTDSRARTILATSPTNAGGAQTIQYQITSSSPDDRDLTGTARLYSTPPGQAERDHGTRAISVLAGQQQTLSWAGVTFPEIGTQRLRVTDTTGPESTLDVVVRGLHLHATQPRSAYTAGNAFGLYFLLEGHGDTPDPMPLTSQAFDVTILNRTFEIARQTLVTDSAGQAYLHFETAEDHQTLRWVAGNTITWLGADYDLEATGTVLIEPASIAAIDQNVTALRADLGELQLEGVHLDELGSRNLWMTSLRAAGSVALVLLVIVLVVMIAIRV